MDSTGGFGGAGVATAMTFAILVVAGCGGDDGSQDVQAEQLAQQRIAQERKEADQLARQDERIKDLNRRLRERSGASAPPQVLARPNVDANSDLAEMAGVWHGQATQRAPSGAVDPALITVSLRAAGSGISGNLREAVRGDVCRGDLAMLSEAGGRVTFRYGEQGGAKNCIATTTVVLSLTPEGKLNFAETYDTTRGRGRLDGTLNR